MKPKRASRCWEFVSVCRCSSKAAKKMSGVKGLGLLRGSVRRFGGAAFETKPALKALQIGTDALSYPAGAPTFWFVPYQAYAWRAPHRIIFRSQLLRRPDGSTDVLAYSDYGGPFCASAGRGNVMGVQFHPEKSQRAVAGWILKAIPWACGLKP